MRGIVELWLSQLYRLTVLWPAWLLTPDGRKLLFSRSILWRAALMLVFALAVIGFMYAALPADLAMIGAGDLVAYFDVAVIAWVAGVGGALKAAVSWAGRRLRPRVQVAARPRGRTAMRRRGPRRSRPPANDDGFPGERWTVAA
ncbi:MAG: hypothetical protein JSR98_16145 [Proteobacteria bacterium]|nr:hypothetical protein [Pseudomonadota bacterium]